MIEDQDQDDETLEARITDVETRVTAGFDYDNKVLEDDSSYTPEVRLLNQYCAWRSNLKRYLRDRAYEYKTAIKDPSTPEDVRENSKRTVALLEYIQRSF